MKKSELRNIIKEELSKSSITEMIYPSDTSKKGVHKIGEIKIQSAALIITILYACEEKKSGVDASITMYTEPSETGNVIAYRYFDSLAEAKTWLLINYRNAKIEKL